MNNPIPVEDFFNKHTSKSKRCIFITTDGKLCFRITLERLKTFQHSFEVIGDRKYPSYIVKEGFVHEHNHQTMS